MSFEVIELEGEREEPNPEDLIFINVGRVSGSSQEDGTSPDDQIEYNEKDLKWMGAQIPTEEFIIKMQQHTSEGYDRKDFDRFKFLHEVGINGVKANAVMCRDVDRLFGRDESGEYDKFGQSLENYIRDEGMHLYEGRKWYDLKNIKHQIEIVEKKSDSKKEAKKIAMRTNRGTFAMVKAGAPASKPPFLWDFKTKKIKKSGNKKQIQVEYWLIDEKVDIFWEVVNRYRTKKYGYVEIAEALTREGYRYRTRGTEVEHEITQWVIAEFLDKKVFYTGIWEMNPIKHKETGQTIKSVVQLPVIDKEGRRLPDLQMWEELQAIKAERSDFNGTKKHKYLLSGIVRCGVCGKRMPPLPINRTVNGKRLHSFYYNCNKQMGGCGILVPLKPFEKSVLDMHEYLLKDPSQFISSTNGNREAIKGIEEKIRRKEKEKNYIKTEMDGIFRNLKAGTLEGEFLERANQEYNQLAKDIKNKETEIAELKLEIEELSKIKAVSTRLSAIVNEIMKAGFSAYSFEQKKDFLRTLYPFSNETYHIKVWRDGKKQFHWEAKGKLSENSIMGYFHSLDTKGNEIETDIECIIGRKITDGERKALDKYGLSDKILWKSSDIRKVRDLLNFYSADKGNFTCIITNY